MKKSIKPPKKRLKVKNKYEGFEAYFYNECRNVVSPKVLDLMILSIRTYAKSIKENYYEKIKKANEAIEKEG